MTASEFFNWWFARLGELVPAPLRGSWHDVRASVTVKLGEGRVSLSTPPDNAVTTFELAALKNNERPDGLDAFLSQLRGEPQRIRLLVGPEEYLLRQLTLPRAAQSHLAEAVRYQLPQLTPFPADRLVYACGEATDTTTGGDGPLSAWLVAIPRHHLAQVLGLIGQSVPESPLPLRKPPAAGEPLEISWRVTEGTASPRRRLAWGGAVLLWVAVSIVYLQNRHERQAELDETLASLRSRAVEVSDLRERLENARARGAWLAERKASAVSPLALLSDLSELLGDETWLEGFDLQGDRLTLRGISSSAAALIETLEASRQLREVRFESAITRDGGGQGDRFNISARLVTPGEESGS